MITNEVRFPFRLANAFFVKLEASRQPEVPDSVRLSFQVQVSVLEDDFPNKLQVNLRLHTDSEGPLHLRMELVGLFELVDGQPIPDRDIIASFVNERALFLMWPYVSQLARDLSVRMAANPLSLPAPYLFRYGHEGTEHPVREEE